VIRSNNVHQQLVIRLFEKHEYVIPSQCQFLMSDMSTVKSLLQVKPPLGFDLIVIDPPWENKSVHRSNSYATLPNFSLFQLPINQLLSPHISTTPSNQKEISSENNSDQPLHVCSPPSSRTTQKFVAIWVTNKAKFQRFIIDQLFPHWGIQYITSWYWLKVTDSGEFVSDLDSTHRKPYEVVMIGILQPPPASLSEENPSLASMYSLLPRDFVFVSVPGSHSRKPPLETFFNSVLPQVSERRCLEMFARNLLPNWTSWGNEVIYFQHKSFFVQKENTTTA